MMDGCDGGMAWRGDHGDIGVDRDRWVWVM